MPVLAEALCDGSLRAVGIALPPLLAYLGAVSRDLSKSVIIILLRGGHVCLSQRAPAERMGGQYSLPGGGVDEGEASWVEAAQREVKEETGLNIPSQRFLQLEWLSSTGEDWQPVGGLFYVVELLPGEEPTLSAEEAVCLGPWKWFTFAEACALPLTPICRTLLYLLARGQLSP